MKFRTLFTVAIAILFFSCKNDKKEVEKPKLKNYTVEFNINIKQPDSLKLYFTDSDDPYFTETNTIMLPVKGDSLAQNVKFDLPGGMIPTFMRLDFNNKMQDVLTINSLKASYNNKVYIKQDTIMGGLFTANNDIEMLKELNTFKLKNSSATFDPFIFSNAVLKEELVKLSK